MTDPVIRENLQLLIDALIETGRPFIIHHPKIVPTPIQPCKGGCVPEVKR